MNIFKILQQQFVLSKNRKLAKKLLVKLGYFDLLKHTGKITDCDDINLNRAIILFKIHYFGLHNQTPVLDKRTMHRLKFVVNARQVA